MEFTFTVAVISVGRSFALTWINELSIAVVVVVGLSISVEPSCTIAVGRSFSVELSFAFAIVPLS